MRYASASVAWCLLALTVGASSQTLAQDEPTVVVVTTQYLVPDRVLLELLDDVREIMTWSANRIAATPGVRVDTVITKIRVPWV